MRGGQHDATRSGADGQHRNPPGSALSLTREINYNPFSRKLLVNPMPELDLLRNGSLFSADSMELKHGSTQTLPLGSPGDLLAGGVVDFIASFVLGSDGTSFGVSVLANAENLMDSTTVRVSPPGSDGVYHGVASGRIELQPEDCPWGNWWECTQKSGVHRQPKSVSCTHDPHRCFISRDVS